MVHFLFIYLFCLFGDLRVREGCCYCCFLFFFFMFWLPHRRDILLDQQTSYKVTFTDGRDKPVHLH